MHDASRLERIGSVRALDGERIRISVALDPCDGCGHDCSVSRFGRRSATEIDLPASAAPPGLAPGDSVRLSLAATASGRLSLLGYLFPVLALLGGAALGQSAADASQSDLAAALGGAAGLLLALLALKLARYGDLPADIHIAGHTPPAAACPQALLYFPPSPTQEPTP